MDALNNLIGIGNDISQFLMGKYWYQDLYEDDEDYTRPLMELICSSSLATPLGLRFRWS